MSSNHELIISFDDQSENYVLGFEAGLLYQKLEAGLVIDEYSVHTKNVPTLTRIASHFGYSADYMSTNVEGWSTISLSRGKPKLRVV